MKSSSALLSATLTTSILCIAYLCVLLYRIYNYNLFAGIIGVQRNVIFLKKTFHGLLGFMESDESDIFGEKEAKIPSTDEISPTLIQ